MGSQKTKMGKRIIGIIFLVILFLGIVVATVFANATDTGHTLTPTEGWSDFGKYMLMCLTFLIAFFGVAKLILNNKIKPQCKDFFTKIEAQFVAMNQVKPICGERYVELKDSLITYKNQMQTYLCNVGALQTSFGKLESRFDSFEKRFDHLEAKIDKIK